MGSWCRMGDPPSPQGPRPESNRAYPHGSLPGSMPCTRPLRRRLLYKPKEKKYGSRSCLPREGSRLDSDQACPHAVEEVYTCQTAPTAPVAISKTVWRGDAPYRPHSRKNQKFFVRRKHGPGLAVIVIGLRMPFLALAISCFESILADLGIYEHFPNAVAEL